MYEYIITWVISTLVSMPCPDANKTDAYGVRINNYQSCAVYHFRLDNDTLSKKFTNRDLAIEFYNGAKNRVTVSISGITSTRIDSVKIKK